MIGKSSRITFVAVAVLGTAVVFFAVFGNIETSSQKDDETVFSPAPQNVPQVEIPQEKDSSGKVRDEAETLKTVVLESPILPKDIAMEVPFVLQAPFANWDDPLFQDACEEAAILMAKGWLEKETVFTKEQMETGIREIAGLEKKLLGGYIDSSAVDTARILKEYTDFSGVRAEENVTLNEIKNEIIKGNLVIVPTDGRKLQNPNYNAPGPITHMVVVTGYDSIKKEFITNDSGTRRGEGYRYGEEILFGAIRDYPTGSHYINPISEKDIQKTIIIVEGE